MHRFVALIAIVFAFASLAGVTTANAHRFVSTPLVVLNHVDADNRPIPVMVTVQTGKIDLGSGIVMPCGPYFAIPVDEIRLVLPPPPETPKAVIAVRDPLWPVNNILRPPRRA